MQRHTFLEQLITGISNSPYFPGVVLRHLLTNRKLDIWVSYYVVVFCKHRCGGQINCIKFVKNHMSDEQNREFDKVSNVVQ